jgi:DNA-binding MarR family transcriptional regulator
MDDNIGILVTQVGRLLRRNFDVKARTLGVTRPQWQVLLELSRHQGINQGGLAELLEVEPMTVGRMIDRLEEAGMVERRADPRDRRAWLLYLTEAGHGQLEGMRPLAVQTLETAMNGLDPADRATLSQLLMRMRANLSYRSGLGASSPSASPEEVLSERT